MNPGTFMLTFDTELIWGLFDHRGWRERALVRYGAVREVFPEILATLERHRIRATFAFVGHLFLDRCEKVSGVVHPEMPRPRGAGIKGDWYRFDPGTDLDRDPLWYGRDLVERVREAEPEHEIGAHGFSHALLDTDRDLARAEMAAAAAAARALGLTTRSFVYPRNAVGWTTELKGAGFTHYRATGEAGARRAGGGPLSRAGSFLRRLAGAAPAVGRARRAGDVVEVPSSLPMLPAMGIRRLLPLFSRLREVRRGLERARDESAVFHLWAHPHNFVDRREKMLRYLDRAAALAAAHRDRGDVTVKTMAEITA